MRGFLNICVGVSIIALLSCHVPGKEVPTFENCPNFPKSWNYKEFGAVGTFNFFVLDSRDQPLIVKIYSDSENPSLELTWVEGGERQKSEIELKGEVKSLWATYGNGKVHVSLSEVVDNDFIIKYCFFDFKGWSCEELKEEGEPRVFIALDLSVSILVLSTTKIEYLSKAGDEWASRGSLKISGPATGWTFSTYENSIVAAVANNECKLLWLEFSDSWTKEDTDENLCAPSFADVGTFGFPLVIGKADAEKPSKGYALLDVLDEWDKVGLGDKIHELFAVYQTTCDKAFAIYRDDEGLKRKIVQIEPYSLEMGLERDVELPKGYELIRIVHVAQGSDGRPHILMHVVDEESKEKLLYAMPSSSSQ